MAKSNGLWRITKGRLQTEPPHRACVCVCVICPAVWDNVNISLRISPNRKQTREGERGGRRWRCSRGKYSIMREKWCFCCKQTSGSSVSTLPAWLQPVWNNKYFLSLMLSGAICIINRNIIDLQASAHPGHIHVVVIWQSVQHLNYGGFHQLQSESADTPTPARKRQWGSVMRRHALIPLMSILLTDFVFVSKYAFKNTSDDTRILSLMHWSPFF